MSKHYLLPMDSHLLAVLEQCEASRERLRLANLHRKDDRREKQEAIEFADRRKGPRRWLEKRDIEDGIVEKD